MHDLSNAEIFASGVWNGITITNGNLDEIVQAFQELNSAGKVPLKLGHNDAQEITDGAPALGWVDSVKRVGSKLVANLTGIPTVVFNAIKQGLFKHVSVELLRDAQKNGKTYPTVLDALAILGADIPAVDGLKDLQQLTYSRDLGGTLQTFARDVAFITDDGEDDSSEVAQLRRENSELRAKLAASDSRVQQFTRQQEQSALQAHRDKVVQALEDNVKNGLLSPASRDAFHRLFLSDDAKIKDVTLEHVQEFTRAKALTPGKITARLRANGGLADFSPATESLAFTREVAARDKVDIFQAGVIAQKERPELFQGMIDEHLGR